MANSQPTAFPLAAYEGRAPEAPEWFRRAIAAIPPPQWITVDDARIETYAWGKAGAPGLLFLHGNRAHAGWWNFLAPAFADTFRVASFSWSGMGQSQWRSKYSLDQYVTEALAVAEATGLFENGGRPVLISHSFGGRPALAATRRCGERFSGCVLVDSRLLALQTPARPARSMRYSTQEAALARFRFAPTQRCRQPFIADFLARGSLMWINESEGWTWRFDPAIAQHLHTMDDETSLLHAMRCPLAFVYGAHSSLTPAEVLDIHRRCSPPGSIQISIADAEHHVMADQPHALVGALRRVLSTWIASRR